MKPILFEAGQTDFTTNGLGRLTDAISCTVTEERNGQYELHMEYPIDGHLMEEITYSRIIYAIPADNKAAQPFRIYRISKPLSGVVEIDAEHISYQMMHIPVIGFTATGLADALTGLMENSAETNPFTLSFEPGFGSAATTNGFRVTKPDNLRALLFGQQGSIIDIYGGEWEFDGYNAILHYARGDDKGVTIRYGKNLTDLKQEENIESTYTGICPFWAGMDANGDETVVTLETPVVHSAAANNYPYQRTKVVDFSSEFQEQPTAEQLYNRAAAYIQNNDIGSPKVSLDVSFVALAQTQEYAELTKKEHINLCDTVTVSFPLLNVSTKAKVVKTVWDVLVDRYESITIGEIGGRLSTSLQESENRAVERAVAQTQETGDATYATASQMHSANVEIGRIGSIAYRSLYKGEALSGLNGGRVFINLDIPAQDPAHPIPTDLYVLVDGTVLATVQKLFRFDENGLMYSSGGTSGTWTSIVDANGKVNTANLLGIIADAAGKHSWNLTTGALALTEASVTVGNKTLATYVDDKITAASNAIGQTIQTAFQNYDTALNQAAVLAKLQAGTGGTDTGLYLGQDGLLHMLPERVISGGANIPVAYLPTVIMNGEVVSSTPIKVVNGIVFILPLYTVTFYDEDGETVLGTESVYEGFDCVSVPVPTKQADAEYTYTFAGWAEEVNGETDADLTEDVMGDRSLYAVYTATAIVDPGEGGEEPGGEEPGGEEPSEEEP